MCREMLKLLDIFGNFIKSEDSIKSEDENRWLDTLKQVPVDSGQSQYKLHLMKFFFNLDHLYWLDKKSLN